MISKKPLNKKLLGKVTVDPSLNKDDNHIICPEKYEKAKKEMQNPSFLKLISEAQKNGK